MASRIQVRRGTEADWTSVASSVVLAAGEPAVATGNSKGPILYFGDGSSTFSALKAQVASFTPQSGSNTRNGHITATNDDYTFGMLETGDARSGDTYGMGNGSTLHVKDGATMTFGTDDSGTGTTVTIHDNVTTDFRNIPSFYDGMNIFVGLHNGTSSADGTVTIKRSNTDVVKVDDYGNIVLTPSNDSSTADTNVTLTMSDNADTALDIKASGGATILKVENTEVKSIQPVILGSIPDHAIPNSYATIRSGTNPNNTDSGAQNERKDDDHFKLHVQGGSVTNQRGQLVLIGNRSVDDSMKALVVGKNGTQVAGFEVNYSGLTMMHDAQVRQTGRTLQDNSLVRKDELLATVMAQLTAVDSITSVGNSDSDFPVGAIRVWNERDHTADTFPLQFSRMGQDGNANISLVNAPTGKYLIAGWGANLISARFRVDSCRCATVDHTSGVDETAVTLGDAAHSSFGFIIRLS